MPIWDGRNFGSGMGDNPDPGHIQDTKFSFLDPHQVIFPKSDPRGLFCIMNCDLDLGVKGTGPLMGIRNTLRNILDLFPESLERDCVFKIFYFDPDPKFRSLILDP
jgi:hypothetical protein